MSERSEEERLKVEKIVDELRKEAEGSRDTHGCCVNPVWGCFNAFTERTCDDLSAKTGYPSTFHPNKNCSDL